MRVLLVTPDFPPAPGGIQLLLSRLATHCERLEIRTVAPAVPGSRDFDAQHGLSVRRVATPPGDKTALSALSVVAMAEALRWRPQVVWSGHVVTGPAAAIAARVCRVPFVQHVYALEMAHFGRLARAVLPQATLTIAVSRYAAQLAERAGAPENRIRIVMPGVDLPASRRDRPGSGEVGIITVARLDEPYKGHDVMLRALPLIRARVPEAVWHVVGEGGLRPALQDLADALGLEGAVRFHGALDDEGRDIRLRDARVFAMPSRIPPGSAGEGFGIVYLEAGALGLPVVAGAVGGALDAVEDKETGLLVDPRDHLAVADAITALLLDPGRAAAMGAAGRRKAERHTWPLAARRFEEVVLGAFSFGGGGSADGGGAGERLPATPVER